MKIAVILKPNNGCSFYRCHLPIAFMQYQQGNQVKLFYPEGTHTLENAQDISGTMDQIDEYEPDIIFFNGVIPNKNLEWLKYKRKQGIKFVMDIDDYWELGPNHPVNKHWYKAGLNTIITSMLSEVDVVFTPNEQLRSKVLSFNKNCVVIPNAVPFGTPNYMKTLQVFKLEKMNFLYSGGSTHANDLLILKNKFDRIGTNKSIQDKALFTLAGFNPLPTGHCEWDKMASIFKRTKSYQILSTKPLQEHMTFYDDADVVFIPLANSEFNSCKSFLKVIEASTRKLPVICSNVLPYSELKDYKGIMWENWLENITYCIKNPTFVKDMGEQLAEKMEANFDLQIWSKMRYQIFTHLLNK